LRAEGQSVGGRSLVEGLHRQPTPTRALWRWMTLGFRVLPVPRNCQGPSLAAAPADPWPRRTRRTCSAPVAVFRIRLDANKGWMPIFLPSARDIGIKRTLPFACGMGGARLQLCSFSCTTAVALVHRILELSVCLQPCDQPVPPAIQGLVLGV
jgi:hypothetical protein